MTHPNLDPGVHPDDGKPRHPSVTAILRHFRYDHLPERLQRVSAPVCDLAFHAANTLPEDPELTTGLRKLLEAKDCLVRAALSAPAEGST